MTFDELFNISEPPFPHLNGVTQLDLLQRVAVRSKYDAGVGSFGSGHAPYSLGLILMVAPSSGCVLCACPTSVFVAQSSRPTKMPKTQLFRLPPLVFPTPLFFLCSPLVVSQMFTFSLLGASYLVPIFPFPTTIIQVLVFPLFPIELDQPFSTRIL